MGAREAIAELEFAEQEAARVAPDPAFVGEVSAGMPSGDDPTGADLRIDYLLEKMAAEDDRLAKLNAFSDRKVQMIREYQATEAGKIEKRRAYLEGLIRMHAPGDAERFKSVYGKKSANYPHGKLGFRASPPTVEIVDMEGAVRWAEENRVPVIEKTTRVVSKVDLMNWIKKHEGELPATDAIAYVDGSDTFFVKPEGI